MTNEITPSGMALYEELTIQNSDLPRGRIRDHVKALILSGRLTPGTNIPPTRRLALLWRVDAATVHAGLADLVRERLVIRRHGKGTFVAEQIARLNRVGLYATLESLSDTSSWFRRSVLVEIQRLLAARDIEVHAWIDPRLGSDRGTLWPDLESSVRRKEMQGLVLLDSNTSILKWAQTLSLPLAMLSHGEEPTSVCMDARRMLEMAMQSLAERGCKSVGLITVHPISRAYENYFNDLVEMSAGFGLQIKNSWIRIPDRSMDGFEYVHYGYQSFRELWGQDERPDGLIIEPDNVVEGAMSAILELGVKVPSELQVVLHRNEKHEYLCPFPAVQLITSERACAEALVKQIERQVEGVECSPILIPYRLLSHSGEH